MDFFRNPYYRLNASFLKSIGLWPYQQTKGQRLKQIILHVNIISVVIVQGIKLTELWGDLDAMIECITPMGIQIGACVKSLNCIATCSKMRKLLNYMKKDWSSLTNEEDIKILRKYADAGRKLTLVYAYFLFCSLLVYLIIPMMPQILNIILPLNQSRERKYLYRTQYYVDPADHYYAILFHTYSGTCMTIFIIITIDTMFVTYIQHACGILAMVGQRFKRTVQKINFEIDINSMIKDDTQYRELILCIQEHQNAINFALLIESSYSASYLAQLGISLFLISCSLLQLLLKFGDYMEMYRFFQFNICQMFHLFYNSLAGQKLINESNRFRRSIYCAEWYAFSLRSRSLLRIVMIRATIPLKITANKMYDMSMENFGMFLQTSISYFTVLASLR